MNTNLKKLLNLHGLKMENVGLDPNQTQFSFSEIFNIAKTINCTVNDLFKSVSIAERCYSLTGLTHCIDKGQIDKIVNTIILGGIYNVEGHLYFVTMQPRIKKQYKFTKKLETKLLELLLLNGKYQLARKLSDGKLYYKFKNLFDEKFPKDCLANYMLGDINKELAPDYYSTDLYLNLDDKSKEYATRLLTDNYKRLVNIYNKAKQENNVIEVNENGLFVIRKLNGFDYHYIDEVYLAFDNDKKEEIAQLLSQIK